MRMENENLGVHIPEYKYWEVTFKDDSSHWEKTLYINFKDFSKLIYLLEKTLKKENIDCFVEEPNKNKENKKRRK